MNRIFRSLDSSLSIYSERYKQGYHSKSMGAYTESMLKHVFPLLYAKTHGSLSGFSESCQGFHEYFQQNLVLLESGYYERFWQGYFGGWNFKDIIDSSDIKDSSLTAQNDIVVSKNDSTYVMLRTKSETSCDSKASLKNLDSNKTQKDSSPLAQNDEMSCHVEDEVRNIFKGEISFDLEAESQKIQNLDSNKTQKDSSHSLRMTENQDCKTKESKTYRILDICFGLGYNAMCALHSVRECEIYSPEQDSIDYLRDFTYSNIPKTKEIIDSLASCGTYTCKNGTIHFHRGDALEYLESFPKDFFDFIFQDPFSIEHNSELWSKEYFRKLYEISKQNALISTYAKARRALENARGAGFKTMKYKWGSIFYK